MQFTISRDMGGYTKTDGAGLCISLINKGYIVSGRNRCEREKDC